MLDSMSRQVTIDKAEHFLVPNEDHHTMTQNPLKRKPAQSLNAMIQNLSDKRRKTNECQEINNEELRNIRVGVDISTWIAAACAMRGQDLIDERHLSAFGRNELANKTSNEGSNTEHEGENNQESKTNDGDKMKETVENFIADCTRSVIKKLKSMQYILTPSIIVVLDGSSPPVKKLVVEDRKKARANAESRRDGDVAVSVAADQEDIEELEHRTNKQRFLSAKKAGAGSGKLYGIVVASIIRSLRQEKIAFQVAPYEADGQLTYLCNKGYIDFIVSEDSDFIPYGADAILYKYKPIIPFEYGIDFNDFSENTFKHCTATATLIMKKDLTACTSPTFSLTGFSDVMITMVCIAAGCDYLQSLKGIGLTSARHAVKDAIDIQLVEGGDFVDKVLSGLFTRCYGTLHPREKKEYSKGFVQALTMFCHPVIFDPIQAVCKFANIDSPHELLMTHQPFADIVSDPKKLEAITGSLYEQKMAIYISEGWINPKIMELRDDESTPSQIRSYLEEWNMKQKEILPLQEADGRNDTLQVSQEDTNTPNRVVHLSHPSQSTNATSASKPSTQGTHLSNSSNEELSPNLLSPATPVATAKNLSID